MGCTAAAMLPEQGRIIFRKKFTRPSEQVAASPSIRRVMFPWQNTESPIVYWARQMAQLEASDLLEQDIPSVARTLDEDHTNFKYGLPTWEVNKVCREKYRNDVVKLTLQIAAPEAMQIKKDVRVTFADQLGVIGKRECKSESCRAS